MRITARDLKILTSVYSFGCLTIVQISSLFNLHVKLTQRRVRKLCQDDYLRKVAIPTVKVGKSPYLLYLGERSASILKVLIHKPKLNLKLNHQQQNSDLLISIIASLKDSPINIEVMPEHLIRTAKEEKKIIPDGVFMLMKENKKALTLLEYCAGTEIMRSPNFNEDIQTKIIRYVEVFENNDIKLYENYFGREFNRFRLLFITNNCQRLKAISKIVAEQDSHGFIWLTTLDEFNDRGILGKIWHAPSLDKSNLSIA